MNQFSSFTIGQFAENEVKITADMVAKFALLSGDQNPIHLSSAFASKTVFKRKIVHGALSAALISAVLAKQLPGPGTVILSQSLHFKKPVFIDDKLTIRVTITSIRDDKQIIGLSTICRNASSEILIDGDTIIKFLA